MKRFLKYLQRRRARPLVLTVSWMDDTVDFVLWDTSRPLPLDVARYQVAERGFAGQAYEEAVSTLRAQADARGQIPCWIQETRWLVFPESMPRAVEGERSERRAPKSLLDCCHWLSAEALPAETLSATALLEGGVYACHDFGPEGTGFCAVFGKRLLFVAKGNGQRFSRLSRPRFVAGKALVEVSTDWLSQTLTLYRNKTGLPLKRVRAAWKSGVGEAGGVMAVPLDLGWVPVDWPIGDPQPFDAGVYYLHQRAAGGERGASVRLKIPELERRRTFWAWERRLRFLAMVLMAGWIFLFLGACHQAGDFTAERPASATVEAYQLQRTALKTLQSRWKEAEAARDARQDPIRIVGRLAGLLPEGAQARQISVERTVPHRQYRIHASGTLAGSDAAAAVDRFVERLRADPVRPRVDNLKFKRDGDGLKFEVETVFEYSGRTGG